MDPDDIGVLNVEVLDDIVGDLRGCRNVLKEGLRATSHLVKAVSVARAVGRCPYEARLIEIMGASDLAASTSVFPGKGQSVHQVLAVAVPRLFDDFIAARDFAGALDSAEEYVRAAYDELREAGVPPLVEEARTTRGEAVLSSAVKMVKVFVTSFTRQLDERQILDLPAARVRAELELFDYKMHVRGVADLVVEEPGRRRAVVVEWKTSLGAGDAAPSPDEIVQGYVYSVMVAHRLGHADGAKAVEECAVFPVVIRDRGEINPYSISRCFKTARSSRLSEERILKEIKLAATHLILSMLDLRRVDSSWDRMKERRLCEKDGKVAYRRVPGALRNRGYTLNPLKNDGYPCGYCRFRDACKFYIFSKQDPDETHRLAWRARYRVYGVRENALLPFYSIAKVSRVEGFIPLEGGSRADYFHTIEVDRGELRARLIREVREEEHKRGVPLTVRAGKPVAIFLRDAEEIIYSTSFSGTVDRVEVRGGELTVTVSFEGKLAKLSYFLLRDLLEREGELARGVVAVEGNIDLTHLELMAIDAFQRSVKELARSGEIDVKTAKEIAFEAGYKVKRRLYSLFGPAA